MIKVYVAGSYSSNNIIGVLDNIKKGTKVCAQLLKEGLAPFCPWLDYQFHWYEELKKEEYYNYCIAWLKVSDVMLVLPDYKQSKGTLEEIDIAEARDIPVHFLRSTSYLGIREAAGKIEANKALN